MTGVNAQQRNRDQLYREPRAEVRDFVFDGSVADVFDDMISRSVPLYEAVQDLSLKIAWNAAAPGTRIYDLGCSTGTTLLRFCSGPDCLPADAGITLVGVDNSEPMLAAAAEKLAPFRAQRQIELLAADLTRFTPSDASFIAINYVLQFIPAAERLALLERCAAALIPGGALLVSEKVAHADPALHRLIVDLHHDFKRRNGYSDLEIAQKREALENVLIPLSCSENLALLEQAGLARSTLLMKSLNFATFLALKSKSGQGALPYARSYFVRI